MCTGDVLSTYALPGTCDGGTCTYTETQTDCTLTGKVCQNGACEDPPAPVTYDDHVQPIYDIYCSNCHAGASQTGCSGSACFANFYAASQQPSAKTFCSGLTVGECTLIRIDNGSMPKFAGGSVTQEHRDTIEAWTQGGMLEN